MDGNPARQGIAPKLKVARPWYGGLFSVTVITMIAAAVIISALRTYPVRTITIPEGYTLAEIDRLLFENRIIAEEGSLVALNPKQFGEYWFLAEAYSLEGFLFPDTYEFYEQSSPEIAARRFLDNWNKKAANLFMSRELVMDQLIAASIIEKEIRANQTERALAAGIIYERLKKNMPLQMDATLCFIKSRFGCGRVIPSDKEIDSPYNTYKNKGLPPGPISNPGLSAIKAAVFPKSSEYLYFISDQETGKTVFAKTLDEHTQNIVKYLR